ncbi:Dyp-type peroxidase family [Kitasatospora sp. MAA19]|uniref:Dyp-type peroxidase n=1 Tax=unclassified Kitasatospora TaxID=2633591 RepID=UPI002474B2B3|nr:Dyp-type peroxidase [Kitasatospora sp. MAA19]MDH6705360.1 Dyp-type peroxidase family [Kitasatospora sp. MAA19]
MAPDLRLRESDEIQGDILAGFKKDNVSVLFLKFEDAGRAREWLRQLVPQIATTREVATFNEAFSEARKSSGGDDPKTLKATWLGVSFTYEGLRALSTTDPFVTPPPIGSGLEAFKEGSAKRAGALGDTGDNSPENWLFGNGKNQPIHAVLKLSADSEKDLQAAIEAQRIAAAEQRVLIVYQQNAQTLLGSRRGKEHFGFKDGISEPGIRDFDRPAPARPEELDGHPGTRLIPPGEFVCGEDNDPFSFPKDQYPVWSRNGSFQVIRRLAQDVPGWWSQVSIKLRELKQAKAVPDSATTEWLAARMVGRWRSGAPVCKHQDRDVPNNPSAASDNDFDFRDDLEGLVTPLWSHLRKTSPRAALQESPDKEPFAAKDLDGRRIMRRGTPYGAPFDPASEGPGGPDDPRGLLFICYQADIQRQFEFIQADWMDQPNFPPNRQTDTTPPGHAGPRPVPGKDPVTQEAPDVDFESRDQDGTIRHTPVSFQQFVQTTGSVYAFMPSISVLKALCDGRLTPQGGGQTTGQGGQTGQTQQPGGGQQPKPQPVKAYPCDEFLPVPDQQRRGGQSQYWAFHGDRCRLISVADGSAHTDRKVEDDTWLNTWSCLQGVGRVDCILPMPDLQNPGGKSWYWVFHSTSGRQQYRAVSITCGGGSYTTALERADRDLTAWGSLSGVGQVDCWLPVPDQQRVGGKSWYWVFHTTSGRQQYRLCSIADGSAHTDVRERTDREISQWGSLNGLSRVDCFLPVPDCQRVGGQSEYWAFCGQSYRRISIADGSGHPDRLVSGDRSCDAWASLG